MWLLNNQSEINKVSTNLGLLSQLENIIIPSSGENDIEAKESQNNDILMINSEEDKWNNSQSLQISIPLIKVENQVNIKPNPTFTINLDNRRDSDQELANILANVIFQDSGRAKNQSTIKEESMSTIMRESEKVVEDTKDIYVPSSPINMNTLVKKSTFLDNILKFNVK